jgi:hypothetical protein
MTKPHLCCGRAPSPRSAQVAEDAVETWFECRVCGKQSEHVEGAYADYATAQHVWNSEEYEPATEPTP